jgi:hypothetical protein
MNTTPVPVDDREFSPVDQLIGARLSSPNWDRGGDLLTILEAYFVNRMADSFYSSSILPECRK